MRTILLVLFITICYGFEHQQGTIQVTDLEPHKIFVRDVSFESPFSQIPQIALSIVQIQSEDVSPDFFSRVIDITLQGFKIQIISDALVEALRFSYLAINHEDVQVICSNIEVNNDQLRLKFPEEYQSPPEVAAYLTGMHRKNGEDVVLKVDTIDVGGVLIKTLSKAESSLGLCILVGPEEVFIAKQLPTLSISDGLPQTAFYGISSLIGQNEQEIHIDLNDESVKNTFEVGITFAVIQNEEKYSFILYRETENQVLSFEEIVNTLSNSEIDNQINNLGQERHIQINITQNNQEQSENTDSVVEDQQEQLQDNKNQQLDQESKLQQSNDQKTESIEDRDKQEDQEQVNETQQQPMEPILEVSPTDVYVQLQDESKQEESQVIQQQQQQQYNEDSISSIVIIDESQQMKKESDQITQMATKESQQISEITEQKFIDQKQLDADNQVVETELKSISIQSQELSEEIAIQQQQGNNNKFQDNENTLQSVVEKNNEQKNEDEENQDDVEVYSIDSVQNNIQESSDLAIDTGDEQLQQLESENEDDVQIIDEQTQNIDEDSVIYMEEINQEDQQLETQNTPTDKNFMVIYEGEENSQQLEQANPKNVNIVIQQVVQDDDSTDLQEQNEDALYQDQPQQERQEEESIRIDFGSVTEEFEQNLDTQQLDQEFDAEINSMEIQQQDASNQNDSANNDVTNYSVQKEQEQQQYQQSEQQQSEELQEQQEDTQYNQDLQQVDVNTEVTQEQLNDQEYNLQKQPEDIKQEEQEQQEQQVFIVNTENSQEDGQLQKLEEQLIITDKVVVDQNQQLEQENQDQNTLEQESQVEEKNKDLDKMEQVKLAIEKDEMYKEFELQNIDDLEGPQYQNLASSEDNSSKEQQQNQEQIENNNEISDKVIFPKEALEIVHEIEKEIDPEYNNSDDENNNSDDENKIIIPQFSDYEDNQDISIQSEQNSEITKDSDSQDIEIDVSQLTNKQYILDLYKSFQEEEQNKQQTQEQTIQIQVNDVQEETKMIFLNQESQDLNNDDELEDEIALNSNYIDYSIFYDEAPQQVQQPIEQQKSRVFELAKEKQISTYELYPLPDLIDETAERELINKLKKESQKMKESKLKQEAEPKPQLAKKQVEYSASKLNEDRKKQIYDQIKTDLENKSYEFFRETRNQDINSDPQEYEIEQAFIDWSMGQNVKQQQIQDDHIEAKRLPKFEFLQMANSQNPKDRQCIKYHQLKEQIYEQLKQDLEDNKFTVSDQNSEVPEEYEIEQAYIQWSQSKGMPQMKPLEEESIRNSAYQFIQTDESSKTLEELDIQKQIDQFLGMDGKFQDDDPLLDDFHSFFSVNQKLKANLRRRKVFSV